MKISMLSVPCVAVPQSNIGESLLKAIHLPTTSIVMGPPSCVEPNARTRWSSTPSSAMPVAVRPVPSALVRVATMPPTLSTIVLLAAFLKSHAFSVVTAAVPSSKRRPIMSISVQCAR